MQPLTIEQYRALIKEDQIKIGENVEKTVPHQKTVKITINQDGTIRRSSLLNEY